MERRIGQQIRRTLFASSSDSSHHAHSSVHILHYHIHEDQYLAELQCNKLGNACVARPLPSERTFALLSFLPFLQSWRFFPSISLHLPKYHLIRESMFLQTATLLVPLLAVISLFHQARQ